MMSQPKVAVVTGGASGMGLGVAEALAAKGGWQTHILDLKEDEGQKAASALPNTTFHQVNLTNYSELSNAFKNIFAASGHRLDFVFANAGIVERAGFYEASHTGLDPPPEPDFATFDVNLRACINTVNVARHYMLQSQEKGGAIVVTASVASFWPTEWAPVYTASKHGILGFVRSVARLFKQQDGIRINALCPGAVRTTLVPADVWERVDQDLLTSTEFIAKVVLMLAEGGGIVGSTGREVPADEAYGQAVVTAAGQFHVIPDYEYPDEDVARLMARTNTF